MNQNQQVTNHEMSVPYKTRKELMSNQVTLNGNLATISGGKMKFAVIRDFNGLAHEWAWETVKNIVESGGEFKA